MSYEVTATRRRPQGFSTMLGQDFVASALANSIKKGRIAHAYIFCGPRGVGKTSAARILARSLNCKSGPTITPCGECSNCTEIMQGSSLDVIEIDGASNTGVSDVREIKDEVLFQPNSSRYKIYIIDEVHMLSVSAFNALLKTIEEPPSYIVFIFATTEIHKVPATIRSRCQQYNFRLLDMETIKKALESAALELGIQADSDALFWLAKESGGSMRDAYTLFDQAAAFSEGNITLAKIKEKMGLMGLDELNSFMDFFATQDLGQALSLAQKILDKGVSVEQFLMDMAEYFRNFFLIKNGVEQESILGMSPSLMHTESLELYSYGQIQAALSWIFQLYRDIRYSINPRFEVELLLGKLSNLKNWITPEALIQQVQNLRQEISGGSQQPAKLPDPMNHQSVLDKPSAETARAMSPVATPTSDAASEIADEKTSYEKKVLLTKTLFEGHIEQ